LGCGSAADCEASLLGGVEVSGVVDGGVAAGAVVSAGAFVVEESVAGCCMLPCGGGVCVVVIGSVLLLVAGAAELSLLVWADTKPTVPTIVAAVIAATRILEALIVELLGRCRPVRALSRKSNHRENRLAQP